jgi:hypothetical protein
LIPGHSEFVATLFASGQGAVDEVSEEEALAVPSLNLTGRLNKINLRRVRIHDATLCGDTSNDWQGHGIAAGGIQ